MITCSRCYTQSADLTTICPTCQADLREFSTAAVALQRLRNNPRVKWIRIAVPNDACPVCREIQGTYAKENTPLLPITGCSEKHGCRAYYEPVLAEVYP